MGNEGVIDYFIPSAKELIESRGAENALAAALAFISGTTEITSRSMLTSQTGYVTYICKQNWELRSTGLIRQTLKRHLEETVTASFRGMRMCKDKKSCVFDVPLDKIKKIEEQWKGDKHATLEKLTELPELCEGVSSNPTGGQGSSRDGGYGNRSGGYNNRGGGGGGGGGNYNRGGGYGGGNNGGGGGNYGARNNSWGNSDRNNNFNNRNNNNNNWNDRNGHSNNNDFNNQGGGYNRNNSNFGGGPGRGGKRPAPLMGGNNMNEPDFVRAKKQKTW